MWPVVRCLLEQVITAQMLGLGLLRTQQTVTPTVNRRLSLVVCICITHASTYVYVYIYIYVYKIFVYIYIYHTPYIFHIYISYIDLFISVCWSGTLDIWRHKNWHSEAVSSAWKRWRETWISVWVLVSLGIIEYQISNDYNDYSLINTTRSWMINRHHRIGWWDNVNRNPLLYDGKNPWVSG
jgi:hypothetical protein